VRRRPETGCQQLIDDIGDSSLGGCLWDTRPQMGFEHFPTDPIERTLHRRKLVEHVDAVSVLFDHADHSVEMTLGGTQTEPDRG
jgi:hypothetical protein